VRVCLNEISCIMEGGLESVVCVCVGGGVCRLSERESVRGASVGERECVCKGACGQSLSRGGGPTCCLRSSVMTARWCSCVYIYTYVYIYIYIYIHIHI